MTKGAKTAALLLALTAGVGVVFYVMSTLPPAEPSYAGKKLSYWLRRFDDPTLSPQQQKEVKRAVTTIGTNNLSLLLKWFREPQASYKPPWHERLVGWADSQLNRIRKPRPRPEPYHPSHEAMAVSVFYDFPSVAAGAIPSFTNMLSDKDDDVKGKAAMILGTMGKDALPSLSPLLAHDNATNRCLAAYAVGEIGPDAIPLIPKLEPLLNDESPYPRLAAADALRKLNAPPQMFVPTFLDLIRDGNSEDKRFALEALARTTNAAPFAVPSLLAMLATNQNQEDRVNIYQALNSLDKQAAAAVKTNVFPER